MIANGKFVERSIPFDLFQSKRIRICFMTTRFTTMTRVVEAINTDLGRPLAAAVDSASVEIPIVGSINERSDWIGGET
ncbi:MAG: flagellar basal body P-ring protein FlgI [Bdellovibrionota bacterium]